MDIDIALVIAALAALGKGLDYYRKYRAERRANLSGLALVDTQIYETFVEFERSLRESYEEKAEAIRQIYRGAGRRLTRRRIRNATTEIETRWRQQNKQLELEYRKKLMALTAERFKYSDDLDLTGLVQRYAPMFPLSAQQFTKQASSE